ncbi:MAG: hypothetical protein M1830_001032 [Pleopsidium flavum]|nr:MAG: hypothetical protein M1830_001032 [Pleopsidium flavum]
MVFKPFTHLARQSFAKSLTHGYAQSVVAASQSSYASSTTSFGPFGNHAASRFGKAGTSQFQNAFQNTSNPSGTGAKAGQGNLASSGNGDGGLAAYYAAWQQQQHAGEDNEWKQFQFAKRIGWKASSTAREGKGKGREGAACRQETTTLSRGTVDRAYSASAVDDLKKAQYDAVEVAAVANVDEAIAREVELVKEAAISAENDSADGLPEEVTAHEKLLEPASPSVAASWSPSLVTDSLKLDSSQTSDTTGATSLPDIQTQAYSDHITKLGENQRYAEIPALFEAMLVGGIVPTATAYNALLTAATKLPVAKHQVVPKALDIYSDMLRRKVLPDTTTYTILIQLLTTRALDVMTSKEVLEEKRIRFGGMEEAGKFMFLSSEAEYDILADDDALSIALKLFKASVSVRQDQAYSAEVYRLLVTACAKANRVEDMIRAYAHLESRKVIPFASMFVPMIEAFGAVGDLSSAVECYDEYKSLAIADDNGRLSVLDRKDNEVYAAVIKAYTVCGKTAGGVRFLGKIFDSYQGVTENLEARLEALQDTVVLNALMQARLDSGSFAETLKWIEERNLSAHAQSQAMAKICVAAADSNDTDTATKAFINFSSSAVDSCAPAIAMLALQVRQGNIESAKRYWAMLTSSAHVDLSFIESTAMYTVALIGSGHVEEGLIQARDMFRRVRESLNAPRVKGEVSEEIDESIEFIGRFLNEKRIVPSPHASLSVLWTMVENGGLVSPVAEQMLAGLGPEGIAQLSWKDLALTLQVQAAMFINGSGDIAHSARFAHVFEAVLAGGMPLDKRTTQLIERCLTKIGSDRPGLVQQWHQYTQALVQQTYTPVQSNPRPLPLSVVAPTLYEDNLDPYGSTTDYKGSTVIADELDRNNARSGQNLGQALVRLRNIRRAGRHPRYITYAKLVSAAAREGRMNLVQDVLGMARQDVPFLPQYRVVRYGWISILDAMVGACLVLGNRALAAEYHQELLELGAAPTANTFGLYITTLKDSTKTFDEATEAVKIFHRAKTEGVEPSSFLYNALIGKLGKARRIDDCLFYFTEMRSLGIRPTSVTYGTIVNALCRVSDERFAEELFEEMETMPNYKPRPAPYNSLMQFFLTTKRDRGKVLAYYEMMKSKSIQPTMHTYKLLIDTYATLDPVDMDAAEALLETIRSAGYRPEAVHYASLIHAKGCVLHNMDEARKLFDDILNHGEVRPQACLYQALFEAMVANHRVADTEEILKDMESRRVEMTPYIANTLIHGWATEKNITRSKAVYDDLDLEKREPSTYEAMTRGFLTVEDRDGAADVVCEMLSRGYPSAVSGKIVDLIGRDNPYAESIVASEAAA